MANRNVHTNRGGKGGGSGRKAGAPKAKSKGTFMKILKKIGVTNPLLQVALPVALAAVVVTIGSCAYYNSTKAMYNIKKEVSVTYDTPLTVDLFVEEGGDPSKCSFVSDVSVIDMSKLASYELTLSSGGHKVTSILNVIDDVPPVAEAVPQTVYSIELPDPNDCVTNIQDKSEVTVNYAEGTDLSAGGSLLVSVVLTDAYMNQSVVEVPFTVTSDFNAPLIFGTHDITFKAGEIPDYKEGVTVSDDMDPDPVLIVDDTEIDGITPGEYQLYYIASDAAGNETMVVVNVTVEPGDGNIAAPTSSAGGGGGGSNKKYSNCTTADAYAKASSILGSITNGSMNTVQKGLKIFYWVNHHIAFTSWGTDHTSWAAAACQAFGERHSSCYGQWAACKALCDVAGIPNYKVWRSGSAKVHVWCLCYLNGGWYHCDATQWPGRGHYFIYMMTDAEVKSAPGNHKFIASGLPARATVSVQKYININSATVSSAMVIYTPTPVPTTEAVPTEGTDTTAATSTQAPATQTPAPATTAPAVQTTTPPTAPPTQAPTTPPPTETPETPAPPTNPPTEAPAPDDGQDNTGE
ncbi:Transglutaminase-like superfamily protein [Ruminococcaceae bacterium YRB3002]|nr:Transglutaminase-like superfamily protein [Ruminococcaceae bacterium YRB3002]